MKNKIFIYFTAIINMVALNIYANRPTEWQFGFQEAASPMAERIVQFHSTLMYVLAGIAFLVLVLLLFVIIRFHHKRHPTPKKTTHHTLLEVVWTIIPALIVALIIIPSIKIIYFTDKVPPAEMTIKVIGHQWYWTYEYPDHGNISFDSNMIPSADIKENQYRLLEVDQKVVLPVDTNIRVILTSTDVLHSWAIPAMGIKMDTVPGRLNETWLRANRQGVFYGQCSELCGVNHGFMPIALKIVSKEEFKNWTEKAQKKFA